MLILALVITFGTVLGALLELLLLRQFRNHYTRTPKVTHEFQQLPKAAIVLSLRGNDPHLVACLRGLINQQYPNFSVNIVIDSETDPAWTSLREIQREFGTDCMTVSVLKNRSLHCSLKNSSVIQAIKSLPSDVECVAFCDADAITYPTWLRDLVSPLADPQVGCSTGIRWYSPVDGDFGGIVRFHWNVLASTVIYCSDIPWGGSMVIRRSVLDSGLTDEWSRMFCEDAHTGAHLRRRGLRLACVREATIVNRETTTFQDCATFVNRQTLILRLYTPGWWWLTSALTVYMVILKLTYVATILALVARSEFLAAGVLLLLEGVTFTARLYGSRRLSDIVEQTLAQNGRPIPKAPALTFHLFNSAQILFINALVYSAITRRVTWRGIRYRVNGPTSLVMKKYKPYGQPVYAVPADEAMKKAG